MPTEIIYIGGKLRSEDEKYKFTEETNEIQNSNDLKNGCKVEPIPVRHSYLDGGGLVYYRSWEISGPENIVKKCAAKIERVAKRYDLKRLTKKEYEN